MGGIGAIGCDGRVGGIEAIGVIRAVGAIDGLRGCYRRHEISKKCTGSRYKILPLPCDNIVQLSCLIHRDIVGIRQTSRVLPGDRTSGNDGDMGCIDVYRRHKMEE